MARVGVLGRALPASERRVRHHRVLTWRTLVYVAVLYLVLCQVPLVPRRWSLLPAVGAAVVPVGPTGLDAAQCQLLRDDFVDVFMDADGGEIADCHSAVVALVWDQIVGRKYGVRSFDGVRHNTTDAQLSELLMRAALGTYVDTTDPLRAFARVRADPFEGRVVRVPGDADVKVWVLQVVLFAALAAVWQSWWVGASALDSSSKKEEK